LKKSKDAKFKKKKRKKLVLIVKFLHMRKIIPIVIAYGCCVALLKEKG